MKISIIGASSFIAECFINEIKYNKSFKINLLYQNKKKNINNVNLNIKLYYFNSKDIETIDSEFFNTDLLINFIGKYKGRSLFNSNYLIPLSIFNMSIKYNVKNWINISSIGVYDKSFNFINESTPIKPDNEYEKLKSDLDMKLMSLSKKYYIDLKILRPSSVVALNMTSGYLEKLITMIKYRLFFLINDDKALLNLINIDDLINAIIKLINIKNSKEIIYNISENFTFFEIANLIKKELNINYKFVIIPKKIIVILSYLLLGRILSKSRIKNLTSKNSYSSEKFIKDNDFKFIYGAKKVIKQIIHEKYSIRNN